MSGKKNKTLWIEESIRSIFRLGQLFYYKSVCPLTEKLFELHRSGRFIRKVVKYTVYMIDLINDAGGGALEHLPGNI